MKVSAKTDYAIRALCELAAADDGPVRMESLAQSQEISPKFLEAILADLRRNDFITSQSGHGGGYRLRRPAEQIVLADVVRALNGPLMTVRGECPEDVEYDGAAGHLQQVWIAVRVAIRNVFETVTLADLINGPLPAPVVALTQAEDAWVTHWHRQGTSATLPPG